MKTGYLLRGWCPLTPDGIYSKNRQIADDFSIYESKQKREDMWGRTNNAEDGGRMFSTYKAWQLALSTSASRATRAYRSKTGSVKPDAGDRNLVGFLFAD
ncbi:hypothetical protein ElyMa_003319700 [Elysia marginata]|uniref:Uncharacterized protein n=1 Tax=Elysia marginata TaxID=1093978 RepID=A0AAV4JJF4_9GAST|nr:hypothetical protein ElyMa_003319700 [Elysia marginata]